MYDQKFMVMEIMFFGIFFRVNYDKNLLLQELNLNLNYGLVDLDIINEDVCDNLKKN